MDCEAPGVIKAKYFILSSTVNAGHLVNNNSKPSAGKRRE